MQEQNPQQTQAPYQKPYNLEPNIEAALSYIPLVGIAVFVMEKENKFVRFHALQSILLWIAVIVAQTVVGILTATILLIPLAAILGSAVSIASVVLWLLLSWKAYNNQEYQLPCLGRIAKDKVYK